MQHIWSCGPFYFAILFCAIVCAGHVMLLKVYYRYFHHQYRDVVQELQITVSKDSPEYIRLSRQYDEPLSCLDTFCCH